MVILTIGHSHRTVEQFLSVVTHYEIGTIVDVRSYPVSRRYPWFEGDVLRHHLDGAGIRYHWAGRAMGGGRKSTDDSVNLALDPDQRGFADHMRTPQFKRAVDQLLGLSQRGQVAILCAERNPDHCHRSMISDYLHFQGIRVIHIDGETDSSAHQPNPFARPDLEGIVYDRQTQRDLC